MIAESVGASTFTVAFQLVSPVSLEARHVYRPESILRKSTNIVKRQIIINDLNVNAAQIRQ